MGNILHYRQNDFLKIILFYNIFRDDSNTCKSLGQCCFDKINKVLIYVRIILFFTSFYFLMFSQISRQKDSTMIYYLIMLNILKREYQKRLTFLLENVAVQQDSMITYVHLYYCRLDRMIAVYNSTPLISLKSYYSIVIRSKQ